MESRVIPRHIAGNDLCMDRIRRLGGAPLSCLAIAAIAIGAAGCSSTGDDEGSDTAADEERTTQLEPDADQPLSPSEERGAALFVDTCGSCHTLEAAGTVGQTGPNLDEIPIDEAQVLRAIEIGGRGTGSMPADLYRGKQAREVARFVANSGSGEE